MKRRSRSHSDFVRDHACIVCGVKAGVQAHHVRLGTGGGTGLKPSDRWLVALCKKHHDELHQHGEPAFQFAYNMDLKQQAAWFVQASPKRRELERMP